jgi:putative membrane protein
MEVHMGQMAEKQGQSADVKKIGATMVADHTKATNELMTLAQTKGVKLDTRHKMDKMDSANFDRMYLDQMVKDHTQDIAEFQAEAKSGMDAEVKAFAKKQLPTLQKHLKLVQAAQKKVGGSPGGNGNAGAAKKS